MESVVLKFAKQTVIKVSGATILALASILFVFGTAEASSVYQTPFLDSNQVVDYNCGDLTCRNAQLGSSLSSYLPLGISFDTIQIKLSSTTDPRISLEFDYDTGDSYDSCVDSTCWNDNTTFYAVPGVYSGWVDQGGGVWERSLGQTVTASTTNIQLQFQVDSALPYQSFLYEITTTGQRRNGFFQDDSLGSFAFQLCSQNSCDSFTEFSNFGEYQTRLIYSEVSIGSFASTATVSPLHGDILLTYNPNDQDCFFDFGATCPNGYIISEQSQWGTISSNSIYLSQADFDNSENGINPRDDGQGNYVFLLGTDIPLGETQFIYSEEISGTTADFSFEVTLAGFPSTGSNPTFVTSYFIDTTDWVGADNRPDVMLINISDSSATQVQQLQSFILPLEDGNATKTITSNVALPDGTYTALINFFNMATQRFVLNRTNLTLNFTISNGSLVSQAIVDRSDAIFPVGNDDNLTEQSCGITNIAGCINNAFRFLFYPSSESISDFQSTYESLKTKSPFVYVFQAVDAFQDVYANRNGVFPAISVTIPFGTIEFLNQQMLEAVPYKDVIRTFMSALLWFFLTVTLYRKTITMHDNQTTV